MAKRKKKSNKVLYILLGLLGVVVITAIIGKQAGWIGKVKEIEVNFAEAIRTTIVEKVSASGTVQPVTEVKLSPDVAGEIIELNVKEGDSVFLGQLLVKIRPDNFINALERTQAQLNQQLANLASSRANLSRSEATFVKAEMDYKRSKKLHEEDVISDSDWELAQQNYKVSENDLKSAQQNVEAAKYIVQSSRANVDEAEENLRLTNVFAPVSGTVSKLDVEKGERVVGTRQFTGTEMMRIADLNKMEVRVDVNENDIIRVHLGDTAVIDVDSYSHMDKKFKGLVTAIANTANDKVSQDAVTEFEVKIRILNESYADLLKEGTRFPFRPGMTASVEIITDSKYNVLSVPLSAVTTRVPSDENEESNGDEESNGEESTAIMNNDDKQEVIFIHEDGKAKMVQVEVGISDFENIEILSGIEEGTELVSGPFLAVSKRLKDGDPIKSKESNKKEKKVARGSE